jgi:trimeric autotransporter adhesin
VVSNAMLVGVVSGDNLMLNTTNAMGGFGDKNVGTAKVVSLGGLTLNGAAASNYTLLQPTIYADIFSKALTVTGAVVATRVYDGTTIAAISNATLSGVISGDSVTLSNADSGAFSSKNVGSAKPVSTALMTLVGNDAGNYRLAPLVLRGAIMPKGLAVTGAVVTTKVYDATSLAAITGSGLSGVISGDFVSLTNASFGMFNNKRVGSDKPITTAPMSLVGMDAGNYTLTQPSLTGTILPKGLTVTGITARTKAYDGMLTATLDTTGAFLMGALSSDNVNLNSSTAAGAFVDPKAGVGKPVFVSGLALSGADAGNYTLATPTLSADITPASTVVTLASSINPSLLGSNVVFTTSVAASAGTGASPSGWLQFCTNGIVLGTPLTLAGGLASLSLTDLAAGTNVVSAYYLGDGNFLAASNSLTQVVLLIPGVPRAVSIQDHRDGTVTVTFAGTPNATYVVQASDELALVTWLNLATNIAGADGHWTFDESKGDRSYRYYRAAKP